MISEQRTGAGGNEKRPDNDQAYLKSIARGVLGARLFDSRQKDWGYTGQYNMAG
jgi:hypothetical protein